MKLILGLFGALCCAIFGWLILPTFPLAAVCIWAGAFLGLFCIFDYTVGGIETWMSFQYDVHILSRSGTVGYPDRIDARYSQLMYACHRAEQEYYANPDKVFYAEIHRVRYGRRTFAYSYSPDGEGSFIRHKIGTPRPADMVEAVA